MFFNTPIHTFVWILTNNKKDKRKGKIQLINAEKYCGLLRKRLNNKRKEISEEQRLSILKIYNNFQENEFSKIFENEFFKYSEIHFHEKSLNNKKVSKLIKTTKNNKIKEIINTEIKKHNPNFELKKDYLKTGYEINFQEIFYKYKKYEKINQVDQKINLINKKIGEITQTNSKINFHNSNGSELKKTGIQWMSKIPSEWSIDKIRNIFSFSKEKIGVDKYLTVLSLTQK